MAKERFVIIVALARKANANRLAKLIDKIGGERTFRVKLSSVLGGPATHYVCNWLVDVDRARELRTMVAQIAGARMFSLKNQSYDDVLSSTGLHRWDPRTTA